MTPTPKTLTVNVTDLNEPPGAPTGLSVSPNEENPTTALDVSWTAPDTTGIPPITGYDVQYRVHGQTDWLDHNFDSVGTATKTTISDLASNTTYQVQVRAKNEEGEGQWAMNNSTTEKAQLTVAFSSATYTVREGESATTTVTVTPAADRNVTVTLTMTGTGATLSDLDIGNTLTVARGQSSASFTISGNQDDDAIDSEVTLTITTDDDNVTLNLSLSTVTIVDDEEPNTPPVVTTTSPVTVKENQTTVATLEATDSDDDPITGWSITGGADGTLFSLTYGGVLTFVTAPDHESPKDSNRDNSYEVIVTASDGTDDSDPLTITVNVTDVNEPPPPMEQPAFSASGTDDTTSMLLLRWLAPTLPEGTLSITGYDVEYRMQGEADWTDHDFDSDGSTTETTITSLASNTSYDAQVRAVNAEGSGPWSPTASAKTAEARLTVAFSSTTYTVGEGKDATVTVTVTPTADRDVTVTVTMTGTGATLSGLTDGMLTIERGENSGNLTIAGDQDDDATDGEVTLTLDADENDYVFLGNPSTATVTIEEPNNPPVVTTTSPITVKENQTTVATLEATDSDDDTITGWSITGGSDRALFNLTNGGMLSFKTAPDYENPSDTGGDNGYEVEVTASDGTDNSAPKTLTVNVTDVDEPPGAPTDLSVSTNDDNPTTALDVSWTAPDTTGIPPITGYDVQYRVQGDTNWTTHDFLSNGTTTETTISGLDSNTIYQVQVRAKNDEGGGQWATDSGTTDKSLLTVAFNSATYTVREGESATITVTVTPAADRNVTVTLTMTGTGATLSDLDIGNTLTVARGQSSASFTISGNQDNDNVDDVVTLTLITNADGVTSAVLLPLPSQSRNPTTRQSSQPPRRSP